MSTTEAKLEPRAAERGLVTLGTIASQYKSQRLNLDHWSNRLANFIELQGWLGGGPGWKSGDRCQEAWLRYEKNQPLIAALVACRASQEASFNIHFLYALRCMRLAVEVKR